MVKDNKILIVIMSLLIPPLAVYFKDGIGKHFVINIILCLFFWIPAVVHALWLSFK